MRKVLAWMALLVAIVLLIVLVVRGSTAPDGGMPGAIRVHLAVSPI
jgi:multisubunit Na+/H+ antiporter MnhB subunit